METIRIGAYIYDPDNHRLSWGGRSCTLPELSHRVLMALIGAGPGGLDHRRLSDTAWDGNAGEETVRFAVHGLGGALAGEDPHAQLVRSSPEHGYRLAAPAEPAEEHAAFGKGTVFAGLVLAGMMLLLGLAAFLSESGAATRPSMVGWAAQADAVLLEPIQFQTDPALNPYILPPLEESLSSSLYRAGWVGQRAPYRMKVSFVMEEQRPMLQMELSTRDGIEQWHTRIPVEQASADELAAHAMRFVRQAASTPPKVDRYEHVGLSRD